MANVPQGNKDQEWWNRIINVAVPLVGWGGWKVLEVASNVDFIMSIENETFRILFNLFVDFGWWVLILIGIGWAVLPKKRKTTELVTPSLLVWAVLIAFLWGVLLTVRATGHVPKVIIGWGGGTTHCNSTLATARLASFKKKYDVAIICGVIDPAVDRLADTSITISQPFTIVPGALPISIPVSKAMADKIQSKKAVTIWHEAVLLPKDVYMASIHSLNDVMKRGGKIIDPAFWNES